VFRRGSAGTTFALTCSLPSAFHKAIEETVHSTLEQGLHGWELDCAVTLTHTAYFSPVRAAGDFRKMTPLVLMTALREAGTRVYEPVHRGPGVVHAARHHPGGPRRRVHPGPAREGVFLSEFDDYRPYPGKPPARVRTGDNPLDRKEYLAQVARR
jgi:ribosomal protection tetracycline resistance protein